MNPHARLTPVHGDANDKACLLVLPGGGYGMHAEHEAEVVAEWGRGVTSSAYVLRYELAPAPAPLDDVAAAMRILRTRHEKIAILGFSAGGHLAASACTCLEGEDRPDAGILIYPVITMTDSATHGGSRANLLGNAPTEEAIHAASCERRVTVETPPMFLFHGADDSAVPVQNALMFAASLAAHRVPFELHVPSRGEHGFGMGTLGSPQDWTGLAARWLREALSLH